MPTYTSVQERAIYEGRTGGVSGTVHGPKKQRITNHGYQNFIFPNHENQHVKHCFILFLRTEKCPRSVVEDVEIFSACASMFRMI